MSELVVVLDMTKEGMATRCFAAFADVNVCMMVLQKNPKYKNNIAFGSAGGSAASAGTTSVQPVSLRSIGVPEHPNTFSDGSVLNGTFPTWSLGGVHRSIVCWFRAGARRNTIGPAVV